MTRHSDFALLAIGRPTRIPGVLWNRAVRVVQGVLLKPPATISNLTGAAAFADCRGFGSGRFGGGFVGSGASQEPPHLQFREDTTITSAEALRAIREAALTRGEVHFTTANGVGRSMRFH